MASDAQGWDLEYDLVVLGAGAGGMTAALVGAIEGMRTLVVERTGRVGGTTARSSGTVWIPDNPLQRREGITGDARVAGGNLPAGTVVSITECWNALFGRVYYESSETGQYPAG